MSETAAPTGKPARKRATPTARATTPKPASDTAPVEETTVVVVEETDETPRRIVVDLENDKSSKNFARFSVPQGHAITGAIYAPHGTTRVRVAYDS